MARRLPPVYPFASISAPEWMLRVQSAEPDLYGPPADLADIVVRTLARDPQSRPSAADLTAICRPHLPAALVVAQSSPPTPGRHDRAARPTG